MPQSKKTLNSKFFQFIPKKINDKIDLSTYEGWNKSLIIKIFLKRGSIIDSIFIRENFPKIIDKEKMFINTHGLSIFKSKTKTINLKKFDALNISSDNINYEIKSIEDSILYIVSSENFKKRTSESEYFNFKKDIKAIDIWGGQCISRPYSGANLNVVLFDLKPGFKFNDKGHTNEQITWLIDGSMDFYCNHIKEELTDLKGVDIGPNHEHGGISNGAIGFDAFFPKREEGKYSQSIKTLKF
tara:strand:+ start:101 stop:826 length:726 start_codon:yes stop_codon:yes gene_type:complete